MGQLRTQKTTSQSQSKKHPVHGFASLTETSDAPCSIETKTLRRSDSISLEISMTNAVILYLTIQ
jgi:hypothetical protein